MQEKWKYKIAPSLGGGFEGTPESAWGVEEYIGPNGHGDYPTVFFGLYGLPDFFELWRHKGKKACLWAGSDITNFVNGYWLDDKGKIKLDPAPLATWLNKNVDNYVENEVEKVALAKLGVKSEVVPSFLGNVEDFPVCYKPKDKVRLYSSVSGNDFKLYGWDRIPKLAMDNQTTEFHLYGNTEEFGVPSSTKNIILHGRVPQEQMNVEIKEMTGALRLTEFDGFSELIAKSLLWGQWPVSVIEYPHTLKPENIDLLFRAYEPNMKGREWLLSVVNKYPWNIK